MEKEKTKLYQKWWFWLCIVLIVCVVGSITIICLTQFNDKNSNLIDIQKQINSISEHYSLYIKNDKLILLGENLNKDNQTKLQEIVKVLKENINTTFKNYTSLICIDFMESSGKENELVMKQVYSLPDFTQEESYTYINFDSYKELYNTYEDTMSKYTDLFMSIGR